MTFVVIWAVCAIACAILASNKGRGVVGWLLLGVILGPIALILAAVVSNKKTGQPENGSTGTQGAGISSTRKCPY